MTVREFKARLDAIGDDELCCGTFWLTDDFLSVDPALTREEIAAAMDIAEDNHDASEGFNWWHLERAISEMKVSVTSTPSSISARVSYHGHFHEHGHYRGQKHALHQQTLDHYSTQPAV
ncbi:hypothetical protein HA38_11505 [Pantoea allii]|nr:hypothetical protein HA38_11505 [Pantoea allii]PBK00791.1 hypothetical protein CMR03_08625 [Pantoea allii]